MGQKFQKNSKFNGSALDTFLKIIALKNTLQLSSRTRFIILFGNPPKIKNNSKG